VLHNAMQLTDTTGHCSTEWTKLCVQTDRQVDRQTDRQTGRHKQ